MIIGITGLMGSGKSTLCKEILRNKPNIAYIDVDLFRNKLIKQPYFLFKISKLLNKEIKDKNTLNNEIYNNEISMKIYKSILYDELKKEIKKQKSEIILVEWALIIKDDLLHLFDKLIIINLDMNYILENRKFDGLSIIEVKQRLNIQADQFLDFSDINIPYLIHKNIDDTIKFIE